MLCTCTHYTIHIQIDMHTDTHYAYSHTTTLVHYIHTPVLSCWRLPVWVTCSPKWRSKNIYAHRLHKLLWIARPPALLNQQWHCSHWTSLCMGFCLSGRHLRSPDPLKLLWHTSQINCEGAAVSSPLEHDLHYTCGQPVYLYCWATNDMTETVRHQLHW